LTTGFDEPTINTIIFERLLNLNALLSDDRSWFTDIEQINPHFRNRLREQFSIVWAMGADLDLAEPFLNLLIFTLTGSLNDEDLEKQFLNGKMPEASYVKNLLNAEEVYFDIKETYGDSIKSGESFKSGFGEVHCSTPQKSV